MNNRSARVCVLTGYFLGTHGEAVKLTEGVYMSPVICESFIRVLDEAGVDSYKFYRAGILDTEGLVHEIKRTKKRSDMVASVLLKKFRAHTRAHFFVTKVLGLEPCVTTTDEPQSSSVRVRSYTQSTVH